jgi:hypothetical protein
MEFTYSSEPREVISRSIEHSLCFGIYHEMGEKSPSWVCTAPDRSMELHRADIYEIRETK